MSDTTDPRVTALVTAARGLLRWSDRRWQGRVGIAMCPVCELDETHSQTCPIPALTAALEAFPNDQ